MEKGKIGIANDHAGYEMKEFLVGYLDAMGYDVFDYGTDSPESCDYPDFAHALANAIQAGEVPRGITLCGTGNGIAITANRHRGVRAGLAWNTEIAELIRRHNDANVLSLPARFIDNTEATRIVDTFLNTPFDGGRHQRRVEKIELPEGE